MTCSIDTRTSGIKKISPFSASKMKPQGFSYNTNRSVTRTSELGSHNVCMLKLHRIGGIQQAAILPIHRAVRKLTLEATVEIIHSNATTFKKSLKSLPRATSWTTSKTLLSSTRRALAVLSMTSSERVRSRTGGPDLSNRKG
jgi:hypothetical protein